jgi:hypothetical protein
MIGKILMSGDLLQALRDSYQEIVAAKESQTTQNFVTRNCSVASVRRYMLYAVDLLNLYLRIKRDREWYRDDRDEWW